MNNNFYVKKQFLEVPLPMSCSFIYKLWIHLKGIVLLPIYLVMAYIVGVPGIGFHLRCIVIGVILLFTGRISLKNCYHFFIYPMDSTRYFEFHEVWKSVKDLVFTRYLDVSSPRLIPLLILKSVPDAIAELINPDPRDLRETEKMGIALGLKSRCEFSNDTLDKVRFPPASFDLITCISVLEHIPQDKAIIESMWSLLNYGGKLILTFPCMAQPLEQYISHNPYGVLNPGDDGYTFWQRYYDRKRVESVIFSIIGMPTRIAVYGEKKYGYFLRNASLKRLLGPIYPFWRESYMMATEYQSFTSIDELPGEGVAFLEFIKS